MAKNHVYLDYAAATPLNKQVLAAMKPYLSDQFYNPSAIYLAAKQVNQDLGSARSKVASVLGARSSEIIFAAGGTEANNLAIFGIMKQFPGKHLVVSSLEHDSILQPAKKLASKGFRLTELRPTQEGLITADELNKVITSDTVLISIMYANNEIGTIQSIKELAGVIQQIKIERLKKGNKLPLYFHTDACQAANYLDLHVNRLRVDLMSLNGGKIYGPKQSGVLYVSNKVKLEPLIYGGGQERGLRSGTENVAASIGLAKALELVAKKRPIEVKRLNSLQKLLIDLLSQQLPQAKINGSLKHRLPNNLHITIHGQDNERLLFALDERGIECAAGSACSASSAEPSHVLKSIGLSDKDAQASLRITMGQFTTESSIRYFVDSLSSIVH